MGTILGSNPLPSILGYIIGALTAAEELIRSNGLPADMYGWFQLLLAVGFGVFGRTTKQVNVTNAKTHEEAHVVAPLLKA